MVYRQSTFKGGDGVSLFNTSHPTVAGTFKNTLSTAGRP